ncbi:MAG: type II secretion system secretin GspD [Lentisphaeria bacterium]|nr:type II secretion system secretin GspD [Lentisphaeria bacterium]
MNSTLKKSYHAVRLLLAAAVLPFITSCEALPDFGKEKTDDPDEKFDFVKRNNSERYKEPDKKLPENVDVDTSGRNYDGLKKKAEKLSQSPYEGKYDKTPAEKNADADHKGKPGARNSRFYEDFILFDADDRVEVSMSFASAPILDVLSAFADVLEFNFVAGSDLRTTVTLNVNSTLTRRELWETFDRMLQLANAAAYKDGQLLRIVSAAQTPKQGNLRVANKGVGNSEIVFHMLKNITAREALTQLRPFLMTGGTIAEGSRPAMVVICDSSDNIPKLQSILEIIDNPGRRNWPRAVIPCVNVQPSKIAADLAQVLPVLGFTAATATTRGETPGSVYLTGIDRLQLLVTSAATQEVVDMVKEWVLTLDSTDSDEEERVYVYKVANSKAQQLAQALSVIFTTQGASLTVDTSSGNSRTQQLTTQTTKVANTGNTGSAAFSRAGTNNDLNTTTTVRSNVFTTPVRIFADGIYNRLVIRTTPRVYRVMKALLTRLDSVPAQVLLQVLIVEVSLNDGNEFGMEFNYKGTGGTVMTSAGTNYDGITPGVRPENSTGGNFYIASPHNPDDKFAHIKALATRNKIKIISSPQLLVTSNTEAKIQIGNDVPLITGSVSSSESVSGQVTNTYNYRETGIIMTMTPQVTSSDLISLEIKQEVSEPVTNTISTAKDTPVIQMREIETSMTIGNGKTMIMGGMIQEKNTDDLNSIPIISDIPFLGRLLGHTNQAKTRTEMLVLVTGYIVDEKGKVEDMIKRYNQAVKALSKFEGEISEAHKIDLEREERIRKEKEEKKRKAEAEKLKKEAEKAKKEAEKKRKVEAERIKAEAKAAARKAAAEAEKKQAAPVEVKKDK